jgi:hypothetical protein
MSPHLANPYPRKAGFGLRLANAKRALRRLGRDCLANIYTRAFDNCFENFDGDAVVWALMHKAIEGHDAVLERGIRNMGASVWPHWLEVYEQRGAYAPAAQPQNATADLFDGPLSSELGKGTEP